jgi:cephalosporin-C deacetylase
MPNFDPTYGYTLEKLLSVQPPPEPNGFADFWRARYQNALAIDPQPQLSNRRDQSPQFDCYDFYYHSTGNFQIGGWALVPKQGNITRGVIVGHGYGGREGPDYHLPISNAVFLFPCFRGISRSKRWPISDDPRYHVIHDINNRERYILGGCVEDLWLAVSALLRLFPAVAGHIGLLGISFSGGIGALALPWDKRIQRAHFNVPSFGNHPIRLQLPTWGSAAALQEYQQQHGNILATLSYYDAAVAAKYIQVPVHVAAALADPVVAPPGQFSIYNALPAEKRLFVLEHGHTEYANKANQEKMLLTELKEFFNDL